MTTQVLFADEIARALEISEDDVFEMARTRQLPFAVSTASPRRLFIDARDLSMWREAVRAVHDA
jgi:hypothetical protein